MKPDTETYNWVIQAYTRAESYDRYAMLYTPCIHNKVSVLYAVIVLVILLTFSTGSSINVVGISLRISIYSFKNFQEYLYSLSVPSCLLFNFYNLFRFQYDNLGFKMLLSYSE